MPVPDSSSPGSPKLGPGQRKAVASLLSAMSPAADELGVLFARHGHELALVGGRVRDVFLGRPRGDLDLTTDATPQRVLEIVRGWADHVWTIGIEFGTVGMRKGREVLEITTYRSEQYARKSRKPEVQYGQSLTDDLSRRDFTINAMAARLPSYELVDPFGGMRDLKDKVLRTPGRPEASLSDDPLRIMRAARFAAQLGFAVSPELRAAMTELAPRLSIVSAERISAELSKLMLAAPAGGPRRGIALLVDTRVAEAALLHDIGKPKTRTRLPGGRGAFHHHEVKGAHLARARLTALRFSSEVVADVSRLVELHLRFHGYGTGEWTDSAVRRYITDAGPLLTRLHALTRADCTTRNAAKAQRLARAYDSLEERIAELAAREELASIRPDLDGHDVMRILGIGPGPLVGKALEHLLQLRLEHGPLGEERAVQELLAWAADEGLDVPGSPPAEG